MDDPCMIIQIPVTLTTLIFDGITFKIWRENATNKIIKVEYQED